MKSLSSAFTIFTCLVSSVFAETPCSNYPLNKNAYTRTFDANYTKTNTLDSSVYDLGLMGYGYSSDPAKNALFYNNIKKVQIDTVPGTTIKGLHLISSSSSPCNSTSPCYVNVS